ncbi:DUF3716 domain-containing protein [Aspergillus thermomutatus]|uniref:Uncharacterized protein n=1 Tax=Aspergillus thermomutatus TaxID=41047 RepID=A0A397HRR3_ASPTH|nr:uncharacterized protein CDV56_107786 [Aspergillus thermomutatus]RHZ63994.1 hypothetical protein CDV56_107786 [Aspergillus thermomutatus]
MGSMTCKRKRDAASTRKSASATPKPNTTAGSVAAAANAAEITSTTGPDTTVVPPPDVAPGDWADMAMDITCYEGKPSRAMEALGQKTAVREPVWRATYDPEESFNLGRFVNWEALQVQCIGAVTASPCEHCRRGYGPWAQCVMLQGYLRGSCANCHYNSDGARCSFRPPKTAKAAEKNTAAAASVTTASEAPSHAPAPTPSAAVRAAATAAQKRAKKLHHLCRTTAIACDAAAVALASAARVMSHLAQECVDEAGIHEKVY